MAMLESCRRVQAAGSAGATIAGAHLYGPYFAEDKVGGHSNASWSEMERAFRAGMRHVDHFWCAMSSVPSIRQRFNVPMQASMAEFVLAQPEMSWAPNGSLASSIMGMDHMVRHMSEAHLGHAAGGLPHGDPHARRAHGHRRHDREPREGEAGRHHRAQREAGREADIRQWR
jgi:hypothetical protein